MVAALVTQSHNRCSGGIRGRQPTIGGDEQPRETAGTHVGVTPTAAALTAALS